MGFSDFFRRLFGRRPRTVQRGRRDPLPPPRAADRRTEQLAASGRPAASPAPAAGSWPPPSSGPSWSPPPAAAATVAMPRLERPEPVLAPREVPAPAPRASAPASASGDAGATRYVEAVGAPGGKVVGVLVAVAGELEGEVFRLRDGQSRVGRDSGCEVVVRSEWISREHAKILHQDGQFAIAPLSERNPTFVNEERTEGGELKDGDLVRLGRTTFRFRSIV